MLTEFLRNGMHNGSKILKFSANLFYGESKKLSTGFNLNFPNVLMSCKKEMILPTIRKNFINWEIEMTEIIL